jgi:hypothetical protein
MQLRVHISFLVLARIRTTPANGTRGPIMANILHLGAIVVCLLAPTAFAQDDPLPPNTVPCEAFKKNASGDWVAQADVVFDAAGLSEAMKGDTIINPGNYGYSGLNMYQLLERKCSAHS